jgi:hypothetical protein
MSETATVFYTDNEFDRTATLPGGVPREEAIQRADDQLVALMPDFEVWLDTALKELQRISRSIRKTGADQNALDMLQRNTSYLLELGTTMGFPLITFVAQNFCEVLENIKPGTRTSKAIIECHVNALLLARTDAYRNLQPDQLSEMTEGLRSILRIARAHRDDK